MAITLPGLGGKLAGLHGLDGLSRHNLRIAPRASSYFKLWPFYDAHRNDTDGWFTYNTVNPMDGSVMSWRSDTDDTTLRAQYNNTAGPIWAMHLGPAAVGGNPGAQQGERGSSTTDCIPLTNGVAQAYIHLVWPSAGPYRGPNIDGSRTAISWRAHNLNGDWNIGRIPDTVTFQGKRASDGAWTTLDTYGQITNLTGDTGLRSISLAARVACTEHRLLLADTNSDNSAQSLCYLDINFLEDGSPPSPITG